MKRIMSVAVVVALVAGLAGVALAWGPGMRGAAGPGMMGGAAWAGGGPGMMGAGPMRARWAAGGGPGNCPMATAGPAAASDPAAAAAITEDKAKEIATDYVAKNLAGFTVERVHAVTGRFRTMYEVELKGPNGETRYLHVNPWGGVRPWGPPTAG